MKQGGVSRGMMFYEPGKMYQGAVAIVHADPSESGHGVTVDQSNPLFFIGVVLRALKIPYSLQRSETQPEGLITVQFVGGFPD